MHNNSFLQNLPLYNNGEAIVYNAVLKAAQMQVTNKSTTVITPDTKMFTEAGLTMKEIASIIFYAVPNY
ncbi:MAG: hypothetical protein H7Y86_03985 [Rhizobacter sp.]|nr:hypothetical protein [Ferruginibacter sp.]